MARRERTHVGACPIRQRVGVVAEGLVYEVRCDVQVVRLVSMDARHEGSVERPNRAVKLFWDAARKQVAFTSQLQHHPACHLSTGKSRLFADIVTVTTGQMRGADERRHCGLHLLLNRNAFPRPK